MSNRRGGHHADGAAVLTVPATFFTNYFAGAILLIGLTGIVTQSLALATGRDFLFGLVPKFSPAGYRNIPVWFATAAIAAGAGFAAVAALAWRQRGTSRGQRWGVLATLLALLSAERLGSVITGLDRLASGSAVEPTMVLIGLTAVTTVVVYGWCIHDLPRRVRAHFGSAAATFAGGVALCAFAPSGDAADPLQQRIAHVAMMSAGRMLELAGVTLFLEAIATHLRSQFDEIRIGVDGSLPSTIDSEAIDGVLMIRLSTRRLGRLFGAVVLVLLAGGLAATLGREIAGWNIEGAYRMLGVDFEGNLPTWFSSLLLLACALGMACIAAARHHALDPIWRGWAMLALLFAGMSADEAAALHELTVRPLRSLLAGNPWLRYPVIVPGLALTALIYVYFSRFLDSLPRTTRRQICTGFGVILLGALGVETVGGWFDPVVHGPSVTYALLATLEEALEMFGAIAVLAAVMGHVESHVGTLRIPGRMLSGRAQVGS